MDDDGCGGSKVGFLGAVLAEQRMGPVWETALPEHDVEPGGRQMGQISAVVFRLEVSRMRRGLQEQTQLRGS